MGILDRKKKGWNCRSNPDGSQTCERIEQDKEGNVKSTGTEINISTDPKTCEPVITGDINRIMDDEADDIEKITKRMTAGCKKGVA